MIKIDLTPKAKGGSSFSLGGLDKLSVKMVILSLIFLYGGTALVEMYFQSQLDEISAQQAQVQSQLEAQQGKLRELNQIKQEVDALKAQEEQLASRLEAVKQVINQRQNPFKVMTYIAARGNTKRIQGQRRT